MITDLANFGDLVEKLQSTNGRIEKENILKNYINNESIKDIINFVFNPYIITGISKKKIAKYRDKLDIVNTDCKGVDIHEILKYFMEHNSGRDEDLIWLEIACACYNNKYKDLIYKIVSKDIKIGVQPITLNKVFGEGFIPTFDVMLAQKYFDNPDKLVPEGTEFILTTKLDGVRCVCMNTNQGPKFFSRQGQSIEGLVELEHEFSFLRRSDGIVNVFDGELLLDKQGLESKDLYRETMKIVSADGEKRNIIFNCFDMIPLEAFQKGYCDIDSCTRKMCVMSNIHFNKNLEHIKDVDILYRGVDKSQIDFWLNKITSEGGEGVMINISDAPYECKRSKGLLKVKKMQTCDVRVVGLEEGTGQNEGRLGAFIIEFIGPDGNKYINSVGSGLSFEQREYFWQHQDEILNKIIEVSYFEISNNQNGTYGLRFPVFKHTRYDKTEISMY